MFELSAASTVPMSFKGDSRKNHYNLIAINCTSMTTPVNGKGYEATSTQGLSAPVRELLFNSIADSTKRAYQSDMAHYAARAGSSPRHPRRLRNI